MAWLSGEPVALRQMPRGVAAGNTLQPNIWGFASAGNCRETISAVWPGNTDSRFRGLGASLPSGRPLPYSAASPAAPRWSLVPPAWPLLSFCETHRVSGIASINPQPNSDSSTAARLEMRGRLPEAQPVGDNADVRTSTSPCFERVTRA
jgi:hypothetical protein